MTPQTRRRMLVLSSVGVMLLAWAFGFQRQTHASSMPFTPPPVTATARLTPLFWRNNPTPSQTPTAVLPTATATQPGEAGNGSHNRRERTPTKLSFEPIAPVPAGGRAVLVVHLTTLNGKPAAHQHLKVYLNDEIERQSRTDELGMAVFSLRRDIPVGDHTFTAVYSGSVSANYAPSRTSTRLIIVPALVAIKVVPPLPNIQANVGGQLIASNANGVAWTTVNRGGTFTTEVLPLESSATRHLEFVRWGDSVFLPTREISVPLRQALEIGLAVSYPITMTFVDLQGHPVPAERVSSVILKGTDGGSYTLTAYQNQWFRANWITRRILGLETTQMMYSVESVWVDGTNVVNATQQRFYSEPNATWQVTLLLYASRFQAQDALFRFPIGGGIRLEYPDAKVREWPFGPDHTLALPSLARGLYRASVYDVAGLSVVTPIALSRDQEVVLPIISYLDIGIVFSLGLAVMLGLLFYGRPHLILWLWVLLKSIRGKPRPRSGGRP